MPTLKDSCLTLILVLLLLEPLDAPPSESTEQGNGSGTEPEQEVVQALRQQNTTETEVMVEEQVQTVKTPKCTFSKVVSIDLKRFADSCGGLIRAPILCSFKLGAARAHR